MKILSKAENLFKIKNLKLKIVFLGLGLALMIAGFFYFTQKATASWFDESWAYRKAIPVTNNTTQETNVYIAVALDTTDTTRFQVDCGDIRFTKENGELLPYFIDSPACNNAATDLHVNFDVFPAGAQTIYVYYGNPSAENGFSGGNFSTLASSYTVGSLATEEKAVGPVGYWKFDEGYGQTAHDSTSSRADGTLGANTGSSTDDPSWTAEASCISGKCLSFDGGDYVNVATAITGVKTISFWIKPTSNTASIIDFDGGTHTISASSGTISAGGFTSPTYYINGVTTTSPTLSANVWQHIIISTTTGFNTTTTTIGKINTSYTTGLIDEVKIYNYARTEAQIKADYSSRGASKGSAAVMGQAAQSTYDTAPQLYLKMDDKVSGDAQTLVDSSSAGKNGTTENHTNCLKQGKYGGGCSFDGTDDYVTTTLTSGKTFTWEAWFKTGSTAASYQSIITIPSPSYMLMDLYSGAGSFWSSDGLAGSNLGVTGLNTSTWYHLAFVREADSTTNGYKAYLNGVLVGQANTGVWTSASAIWIGDRSGTTQPYNGLLDEVKVYNYVRTSQQIVSDMQGTGIARTLTSKSPVAYYKFDEGADNTCSGGTNDACNSGFGGSTLDGAFGATTSSPSWSQAGKIGKNISFDGGDLITIPNIGLSGADPFTISAWIKPTATCTSPTFSGIMDFGASSSFAAVGLYYCESVGTKTTNISFCGYGFCYGTAANTITVGTWNHVVITYSGGNVSTGAKAYINGKEHPLTNDQSTDGALNITNSNYGIGYLRRLTGYYFNGAIDEVKVYTYALSADEVKTEYNQGSSLVLGALSDNSTYQPNAANQEYCVPGDSTSCAAPVGEWNFEEGSGTSVSDSSGNANTGTWSGTGSHWVSGKVGKAGKFNGTDDYVDVTDTTTLRPSNLTIEAWINPSVVNATQIVVNNRAIQSSVQTYNYLIYIDSNGKLNLSTGMNSWAWNICVGSTTLVANKWYHVVAVKDGATTGKLYINGVPESVTGCASTAINYTSGTNLNIGRYYISGYEGPIWFNGKIDNVRIFNYARTPAQVAWDYNRGAPVGHWKFDECQGGTAYDSSGNSNNGTITIGASGEDTLGTCTTSSTSWGSGATGKYNSSLSFDGTDDYMSLTPTNSIKPSTAVTLSAWIKPNSGFTSGYRGIIYGDGNGNSYVLVTNITNGLMRTWFAGNAVNGNTPIASGTWTLLTATYDGSTIKQYLNGILDQSQAATGTMSSYAGTMYIGAADTTTYPFPGQIDDVKIFNYALTASQVKTLYNNGAVNFGPVTGTP